MIRRRVTHDEPIGEYRVDQEPASSYDEGRAAITARLGEDEIVTAWRGDRRVGRPGDSC
jgi:hypothetical protein